MSVRRFASLSPAEHDPFGPREDGDLTACVTPLSGVCSQTVPSHIAAIRRGTSAPPAAGEKVAAQTGGLRGRLVRRADLDPACRDAMFALLAAHFDGVCRDVFEGDLAGKDYVILLEEDGGRLQGFSTLHVYQSRISPQRPAVIYSGDTIVRREAWGSAALPRTWVHAVQELTAGLAPPAQVYWLLLTSGYRTYRFLPVFYRQFYPRCDEPTPPAMQHLMERLAVERFGTAYHRSEGVVRFPRPQVLKPDLIEVPDGRRRDCDVAFFLTANPGFVRGDELVCLTRLDEDNLTPAARRMMRSI